MKRISLLVAGILFNCLLFAQTVSITGSLADFSPNIVIGSQGTAPNTNKYHVSEQLYTNAEIGNNFTTVGTAITQINFYLKAAGAPLSVGNYRVSMQNVAGTTTAFSSGQALASSGYTVVFDGTLDATPIDGFVKINLTTPFIRTAGSSLVIKLERLNGLSHPGFEFFCAKGNSTNASAPTSRRNNGNSVPTGTTSLSASAFRPSIQLIHTFAVDARVNSFTLPSVSCFNNNQQIQVSLLNDGTDNIPPSSASVTLNVNGVNTFTSTSQNSGNILPGEFELFNFTGINLNNPGTNQIKAFVVLSGDLNQINDTIETTFITASTTSSFPIVEGFETGSGTQFIHSETLAGSRNLWSLQTGNYDNNDFSQPISPIAPGNKFFLFNSYENPPTLGFVSRLYSNCISLPSPTATTVPIITASFSMTHDNSFVTEFDSLSVSISTNQGASWTRIASFLRYDATASIPVWRRENVDLTSYGGKTIQLAFEGTSAQGNVFGLDNIEISFSNVVPVSMLQFDANRNGKSNHLTWTTAQEINVDRFEVEFSEDGKNFKSIGRLQATNQTTGKQNYRYIDNRTTTGIHYYRIRSVDRDSKYSLSEVRSVRNLGYASLSVFPNPVINQINLEIDLEKTENAVYIITDLSGRRVQTGRLNLNAGSNRMPVSCGNIPKGTYILTLQLNNETLVKKITKL